jgi:hypothetical protein
MADYTNYTHSLYQGGYSSLDPNKSYGSVFSGYNVTTGSLGLTTDPRTANILKDATSKLASGAKNIELTMVTPQLFDSVSKQQLQEVKRQAKLLNVDVSLHGPVIDSAGISQQGFSELNREASERVITNAIERSHEVNPNGNIPVVFHSSEGIPGTEWKEIPWKEKEIKGQAKQIIAINQETGQMMPLREEQKFYPGKKFTGKPEIESPEEHLDTANKSEWDNKISQLFFNKERADEILSRNQVQIKHIMDYIKEQDKNGKKPVLTDVQEQILSKVHDAQNYLSDIRKNANGIFDRAYKYGTKEQQNKLLELNEKYKKDLQKYGEDIMGTSRAMNNLLVELKNPQNDLAPDVFVPIEKFAVDQSSKTFGNAAFNAFNKFKDPNKTPMIVIENPPAGHALSTGEDLKNLVIKSREQFVKKAVKEKGMSKGQAEKVAEKLIGATWDVGHINMLRKQGFEEKDIIKETEKIAPFVKHVHLSDNFGLEHTELPMGMGNVPMKEIMKKLGKKGFEAKKIIEAGNWWQHMQTSPFQATLEGLGTPIYSGTGPYWNQGVQFQQGYLGGYGMMLPQINYQTFGAGFSQLPAELGGQRGGGAGGRMSGRPME